MKHHTVANQVRKKKKKKKNKGNKSTCTKRHSDVFMEEVCVLSKKTTCRLLHVLKTTGTLVTAPEIAARILYPAG